MVLVTEQAHLPVLQANMSPLSYLVSIVPMLPDRLIPGTTTTRVYLSAHLGGLATMCRGGRRRAIE